MVCQMKVRYSTGGDGGGNTTQYKGMQAKCEVKMNTKKMIRKRSEPEKLELNEQQVLYHNTTQYNDML